MASMEKQNPRTIRLPGGLLHVSDNEISTHITFEPGSPSNGHKEKGMSCDRPFFLFGGEGGIRTLDTIRYAVTH